MFEKMFEGGKVFSDRVGVGKSNAPVDRNKCQRQYWVVHKSKPGLYNLDKMIDDYLPLASF